MSGCRLEVLVDFIDDALLADHVLTAGDVDGLMRTLADKGVQRVSWAYYGDGHGGLLMPTDLRDGKSDWRHCNETYRELRNPLRAAVDAGHRYGMEVYAYYKPYETGVSMVIPEGSPEAQSFGLLSHSGGRLAVLDPFVRDNPHLRLKRRTDDLPTRRTDAPICALRLTKRDDTPTRVASDHLQIWTSTNNYRYTRKDIPFRLTETIETASAEVRDQTGSVVTQQGDPVRVLTLSGLHIDEPYVLVTTDFSDGPSDFSHSGTAMLAALDADGREIPGVVATGGGVWLGGRSDFRDWGLIFDYGWGRAVTTLDVSNANGRSGIIAFARGKNPTLPAALCETEPAVQQFWLGCLGEMVAAGVDGVDFREENHCTHTDEPEAYGFNQVVLERCRAGHDLPSEVSRVRGEAYTAFLRQARELLSASGVRLRYHLNMDHFRPDPPPCRALAYPANISFSWQEWLSQGLIDEAVLRSYHYRTEMLSDPVGNAMIEACREAAIPISFNHHVFSDDPWYLEEAVRAGTGGRFDGVVLYEASNFLRTSSDGVCRFTLPVVEDIFRALNSAPHGRGAR